MTSVIIDAIIVVILAAFTVFGAKRGLLRSVAGLLIVAVALVGAGMVAETFTAPAAKLAVPLIQERIEQRLETMKPSVQPATDMGVGQVLELVGIDSALLDDLSARAGEHIAETGATIASAVAESIAHTLVHALLFLAAFLALMVLLRVLLGAMGLVLKLPGLHGLNALGGGLLGLAEGVLLLFLAVWVLRRLGVALDTEALQTAHILRIFTTNTPLSLLSRF